LLSIYRFFDDRSLSIPPIANEATNEANRSNEILILLSEYACSNKNSEKYLADWIPTKTDIKLKTNFIVISPKTLTCRVLTGKLKAFYTVMLLN